MSAHEQLEAEIIAATEWGTREAEAAHKQIDAASPFRAPLYSLRESHGVVVGQCLNRHRAVSAELAARWIAEGRATTDPPKEAS